MPLIICIILGALVGTLEPISKMAPFTGGLFLFLSSWEFNPRELFKDFRTTAKLWAGAFVLPFASGASLPYLFPALFGIAPDTPGPYSQERLAIVLGIAVSVSAVPVIIKIMQELGWMGTERARLVVSTAILCDLTAWLLFIPILPPVDQVTWVTSHFPLFLFLLGLVIALVFPKVTEPNEKLHLINLWIVAPLFFFTIGQKLDFTTGFHTTQIMVIFVTATVSKVAGVWFAARQANISKEESYAIALSLNARGAMEIAMASFALQAGLIDSILFLSLVVMAIATSLIIKPIFKLRESFARS